MDKAKHVEKFPFSLGYDAFRVGLSESDSWLIVGYSFRDHCVNEELREEFIKRESKPTVLVCTFGEDLTREEIERAFGWGAEDGTSWTWLWINRDGAIGLEKSFEWGAFKSLADQKQIKTA